MKTIVTHFAPDVDAVTSIWLIKRFLSGWEQAALAFVPAGKTLNNSIVDTQADILHVDTGLGKFDHHQTDEDTCAAKRVLEYLRKESPERNQHKLFDESLERLVEVVNDIDHFREIFFPNPNADFYDFSLVAILDGLKLLYPEDYQKLVEIGLNNLDAIYRTFQNKVWAEEEIKKNGVEFKTRWGQAMGVETLNDETLKIAQKQGFKVAVRKDPKKGYVRIKAFPDSNIDLTPCYNQYRKLDQKATWYLHPTKKMILNGSIKNPESKPTKLTLREIIEVLKGEEKKH